MPEANVLIALAICAGAALATMVGGLSVVVARQPSPRLLSFGLSFAGGAMVYISLVEIFWKSHSSFTAALGGDRPGYLAATLAFFAGVLLVVLLEWLVPNPHGQLNKIADASSRERVRRLGMLTALAITAHNVPEGMATFFAALDNPQVGVSLALAIAIHNIPEGVSIAVPVFFATQSVRLTLLACAISALAEPFGAIVGYLILAPFLSPFVYGAIFGLIAGVMVFLALDELLPTAKRHGHGHDTTYGILLGMGSIALSLVLFR